MAKKQNTNCLLNRSESADCRNGCAHCGWNEEEHTHRIDAIRNDGLVEDKDGLKRLHVKTKEDPEPDADCNL